MQKHVNLVDLVKSFPTNIFLQNLASIQKRASPVKFDHLAEKSEKGSISNISTKVLSREEERAVAERLFALGVRDGCTMEVAPTVDGFPLEKSLEVLDELLSIASASR